MDCSLCFSNAFYFKVYFYFLCMNVLLAFVYVHHKCVVPQGDQKNVSESSGTELRIRL